MIAMQPLATTATTTTTATTNNNNNNKNNNNDHNRPEILSKTDVTVSTSGGPPVAKTNKF